MLKFQKPKNVLSKVDFYWFLLIPMKINDQINDNTKYLWQLYALENDNTNCVTDMKDNPIRKNLLHA